MPTVMEPLRADWDGVVGAVEEAMRAGKPAAAAGFVRDFHAALCRVRVLDPACGTGNFLYVTLELMKRLEGEVLDSLAGLVPNLAERLDLSGVTVSPHQFLGLDVNPRGAGGGAGAVNRLPAMALPHQRPRAAGRADPARLPDYPAGGRAAERDAHGAGAERRRPSRDPVGRRTKLHPITGEVVPDETDQVPVLRHMGGKQATWPEAEFIVGNPPFVAGKDLRAELGSGYAEALWAAYPKVPKSADLALFFWWRARPGGSG